MKWLTAALLAVAAVLAGLLLYRTLTPPALAGDALDTPEPLPTLQLFDERGVPTPLNRADGRVRLVFYGFTRCPDVCPATLTSLKGTYAGLTPALKRRVQVQFITVDPEHDTPAVVRAYLGRFDAAFTGLTGPAAHIDAAARAMFVGNVKPLPGPEHSAHAGAAATGPAAAQPGAAQDAARIHGDQVSVVDGRGRLVRVYGNDAVIGGRLERDLPALVRVYGGT